MPTGTGKSGVIAVAAQQLVTTGDVLLLTPWDVLVEQLIDDVGSRFWGRIGVPVPSGKKLIRIFPSNAAGELALHEAPTIWLSTITTLERLHAHARSVYAELQDRLQLVVVDEGHYEPARSWSDAVRSLRRPIVLFTATPYRNDVKYFNLDDSYQFHYSHSEAEADHILRKISWEPIPFHNTESFCGQLLHVVERCLSSFADAKVIVRCDSLTSVQNMVNELLLRGQSVVGIHERFESSDEVRRRRVPKPHECDARYWVHQYKLMEGIDSDAFRAVAFFQPLPSERGFVQQVGRVLRNPTRSPDEAGTVIFNVRDALDKSWDAYKAYDRAAVGGISKSPLEIALAQPPPQYFDGKFRNTFDIQGNVEPEDLLYPRSVKIYRVLAGFNLKMLMKAVEENLKENDCVHTRILSPTPDMRVHLYMAIHNAPVLARDAFYQSSLGFTSYRLIRDYLFFNDSMGLRPEMLDKFAIADTERLQRLYFGENARLGSVSLSNTDLGPFGARRRTLHSRSIAELGPDLSDHAQLATTSSGYFETRDSEGSIIYVSRYVGFSRARVSDRGLVEFGEYKRWLEELAAALDNTRNTPLPVFNRFAEVIDMPADPSPRNILLDFDRDDFVDRSSKTRERLRIDDTCMEVDNGFFVCRANDEDYAVSIKWDGRRRRYLLDCKDLDQRFSSSDAKEGPPSQSLIGYLNREQAFRIIPKGTQNEYCIYTGGRFCRPRLPLGPSAASENPDLLALIEPSPELRVITSEKGEAGTATPAGWASGTLFGLIDSLGRGSLAVEQHMAGIDVLVCDDMGTEIANFVALDTMRRRVIAIHAKSFRVSKPLSASALHDVSSQALKNLGWFQPYFVGEPKNLRHWDREWRGPAGTVAKRIRIGNGLSFDIWTQIRNALRDPRTTREIWIMLGRGPSKSKLLENSRQDDPGPEVVQMLYSLQSTWGAVSSVGAKLQVFSSP